MTHARATLSARWTLGVSLALVVLGGCIEPAGGPSLEPLPELHFVPASAPTEAEERGVDFEAGTTLGVHLEWFTPPVGELEEVSVLRAGTDRAFDRIGAFAPDDTMLIDFVADLGTWYYTLEGRSFDGRTRASGDTLAITLIQTANPLFPSPSAAVGPNPEFQWSWPEPGALPAFVVRVEDLAGESVWISPQLEFFEGAETIQVAYEDGLAPPDLSPGPYRWRVDAVDLSDPLRGSESSWSEFRVQ
jgi:hypothetical protein